MTPREPTPVPGKSGAPLKTGGVDEDGGTAGEERCRKFQKKIKIGRQETFSSSDTTDGEVDLPVRRAQSPKSWYSLPARKKSHTRTGPHEKFPKKPGWPHISVLGSATVIILAYV